MTGPTSGGGSDDRLRVLIDEAADGAWNMAVDEALLDGVADGGPAVLRLYRWLRPTISLGYFQTPKDLPTQLQTRRCPLVRRLSGGGAIVHDHELTYSLVLPKAHPLASQTPRLYRGVHDALIALFASWSIRLQPHEGVSAGRSAAKLPFLCFERRSQGDLTLDGHKVVGSAQRRRGRAVLQHGSILLKASAVALHLPGVWDVSDTKVDTDDLIQRVVSCLAATLALTTRVSKLTPGEEDFAKILVLEKYADAGWTARHKMRR